MIYLIIRLLADIGVRTVYTGCDQVHSNVSNIWCFVSHCLVHVSKAGFAAFLWLSIQYMYPLTYLLTYLLTPCRRVLLVKLNGFQLVKKFPAFYGTQRFITAFTSAHYRWVPVTTAWRVRTLRMGERPAVWRVAANILKKKAISDSRQGVALQLAVWARYQQILTVKTSIVTKNF